MNLLVIVFVLVLVRVFIRVIVLLVVKEDLLKWFMVIRGLMLVIFSKCLWVGEVEVRIKVGGIIVVF